MQLRLLSLSLNLTATVVSKWERAHRAQSGGVVRPSEPSFFPSYKIESLKEQYHLYVGNQS
jgi:hypothetical protein